MAQAQVRGPKIRTFCSTDPEDFRTFEKHVGYIVEINQWGARRARLELAAAMSGTAAELVRHIDIGVQGVDPDDVAPYAELLNQYRACFSTDAHEDMARGEFQFMEQKESETLIAWHARLRSKFVRAYPGVPAADVDLDQTLRDRFLAGLRDRYIARHTYAQRPANYTETLEVATTFETSKKFTQGEKFQGKKRAAYLDKDPSTSNFYSWNRNPNVSSSSVSSSSFNPTGAGGSGCFICGQKEHWAKECPLKGALANLASRQGGRGRGRGRGRGGRGGRGRGRPNLEQIRKQVAALTEAVSAEFDDEDDAEYGGGENGDDEVIPNPGDLDEDSEAEN